MGGEPRGSAAHWLLILPGAVVVYALVGALWHPLFGGQEYVCFEGPWVAVFVGAVAVGVALLIAGLVRLIARKQRLEGWTAFAGVLTIAAGFIVYEVAAANDYNVCSS